MTSLEKYIERFNQLKARERKMVIGMTVAVVITLLWVGLYEPLVESRDLMQRKIAARESELAEVKLLAAKVSALSSKISAFQKRLGSGTSRPPLSELEGIATDAGVRENITSLSPSAPTDADGFSERLVAVKMDKVTLGALVGFLKKLSSAVNPMHITRMAIKPEYEDNTLLDVTLTIAVYESK